MTTNKPILKQRYQIEKRLGRGAMGEVFLATDLQEQEPVAIKTISQELHDVEEVHKRFEREAHALSRLNHPNIIRYIDAFTVQKRACLVMEYIGGGTLDDIIKTHDGLDDGIFKRLAVGIVEGLSAAHEAGIIHRDLKPTNILLTADQTPVIADFGLARMQDSSTMTATGAALGTLAYMAPEAFDPLTKSDFRADIWSLGVIFFEMLTGHLPFSGKTQPQIIGAILTDPPHSLQMFRRDLPPSWYLMVETCLQKNILDRFQSTRDILQDLNEIPRARQEQREPDPLNSQFEFRFIDFEVDEQRQAPVIKAKEHLGLPAQPAPSIEQRWQPREQKTLPLGGMIFSATLIWLGVAATFVGILGAILDFTSASEEFALSPQAVQGLLLVGALMFAIGVVVEAFLDPKNAFLLLIIGGATAVLWLLFFSEQIFTGFFALLLGTMFYLVAILGYFQVRR